MATLNYSTQIPVTNPIPNQQDYNTNKGAYGVDQNINLMGQNYNLADKTQFDAYQAKINATPPQKTVTPPTPTKSQDQQTYDTNKAEFDQIQNEKDVAFKKFNDAATAYANGATPLSAGQQAQIQGLTQQFNQLIDQQKQVNQGAEGTANIRGYQTGSAEYDPNFQVKVIGNIFSAGQAKVADLQTRMASAVAQLTSDFQAENYSGVKSAWDEYSKYADESKQVFSDNMKQAQAAIAAAQEQQRQSERDNTIAELINNGYTNPSEILQGLNSTGANYTAKEVGDTIASLIKNQSYPGGIVGEYQFYSDQEKNSGRIPLSFNDYQTLDANRKASIARAGVGASGLDSGTLSKVQSIANQFDSEQSVKNFQVIAEAKAFLDSLGTGQGGSAGDDQGLLYAFAKVMDPNSVVREGEYNTVQRYAQSWADTYKFNAKRIYSNSPFLTDDAREQMKSTVSAKAKASLDNYQNIYDEYGRRINKITGSKDGVDYLTSYAKGFPTLDINADMAKKTIDAYIKNNPDKAPEIADLYEVQGANDEDVIGYLKLKGFIK